MSGGVQRGHVIRRLRPTLREPVDAPEQDATENRALFASDAARRAAFETQRRRIQREIAKRRKSHDPRRAR